jgi:hypothetical protein
MIKEQYCRKETSRYVTIFIRDPILQSSVFFIEIGHLAPAFFGGHRAGRGGRTPAGCRLPAPLPAYHWATAQSAIFRVLSLLPSLLVHLFVSSIWDDVADWLGWLPTGGSSLPISLLGLCLDYFVDSFWSMKSCLQIFRGHFAEICSQVPDNSRR